MVDAWGDCQSNAPVELEQKTADRHKDHLGGPSDWLLRFVPTWSGVTKSGAEGEEGTNGEDEGTMPHVEVTKEVAQKNNS